MTGLRTKHPYTERFESPGLNDYTDQVSEVTCETKHGAVDTCLIDTHGEGETRKLDVDEFLFQGGFGSSLAFSRDGSQAMRFSGWDPETGVMFDEMEGAQCVVGTVDSEYQDKTTLLCADEGESLVLENIDGGTEDQIYADASKLGIGNY